MASKAQAPILSPYYQIGEALNVPRTIAIEIIFSKPDPDTDEEVRQQERDKWLTDYAT